MKLKEIFMNWLSAILGFAKETLTPSQKVVRCLSFDEMRQGLYCPGGRWISKLTKDPLIIGKIYEHLRTSSEIRLYITDTNIEWSAYTLKHGWVCGSCRRNSYMFFEFGLIRSGHRFDIYSEDRSDYTISEFYKWWGDLVKPYEEEFDKDYNL